MGEQWLSFKEEAWILNWTESRTSHVPAKSSPVGYKSSGDRSSTSSRALDEGPSLLECVLFSVFGTLVGLFLIFQLVLYVRFCITGHHDWKWSLPYLLRLRRVECMSRPRGKPEGAGGSGDGGNADSAEPMAPGDGRWDTGGGSGAAVWAHVYPGERAGTALPCRRGFFFTTRSLSSYFRSIAASMLPNGGSSATGEAPTTASQAEAATCGEGSTTEAGLKPIPAAVFLVDPRNPESQLERTASVALPTSRGSSRWRRPCNLISSGRWSAPAAAALNDPHRNQGDVVLFHCENPGYESDASMAFTHTDDEGAATDPGVGDTTHSVGHAEVASDDSLTSISSLSLSSVSRLQAGMASLIARRTNSARSRTSRKRLSSSEQAGETKRVKFKTHSRSNSTSSGTQGGVATTRGQYANTSEGPGQVAAGSSAIGGVTSRNDLNKESLSSEKLIKDQVLGTRLDRQGVPVQNIRVTSAPNGGVAVHTNLDMGAYSQKLKDVKDIKGKTIDAVESSCEGNSPDSNSS